MLPHQIARPLPVLEKRRIRDLALQLLEAGAFTLNYVDISYDSTGDVWSGAASVTFPTAMVMGSVAVVNMPYGAIVG